MFHNHHTHNYFCDGSDHPEEYVKSAIRAGLQSLGFSSHAPMPFNNSFAIKDERELENYCQLIRKLKAEYQQQIKIYLSLEIDYINGVTTDFSIFKRLCRLDYTIGSVHLVRNENPDDLWFIDGPKVETYDNGLKKVFGNDIRKGVTAFWHQTNQMILSQNPDITGHLDKIKMNNQGRYFHEDEKWYRDLWMETLGIIKQSGTIVEVNTRGIYKKRCKDLYPGIEILKELLRQGIPVALNSDAHRPDEIDGYFKEATALLKELGFRKLLYFEDSLWKEQPI